MQITKTNARRTSHFVRFWLGCIIAATTTVTARAQTYYYYPASVTSPSTVPVGVNTAPTYYYTQPTYQYQVAPATYAPQYYQVAYQPQYYQQASAPQYYQQASAPQYYQVAYQPQVSVDAQVMTSAAPVGQSYGDPYGFTAWLNSVRASYGLGAVGYDPNLSGWAAENNNQQAARGMGHYVMGGARRQNSAMGAFANIGSMWMNSPAHRAALLDPTITSIGIAGLGAYWTFNAN